MYSLGMDVSFWQGTIDFNKAVKKGITFVFIKATEGRGIDPFFKENRKKVKEAGLLYGFYHFLKWNVNAKAQAKYFWETVKDDCGELPLVVDFEENRNVATPKNAILYLEDFIEELESISGGKEIMIYTGAFFWQDYGSKHEMWNKYKLWVSSYTSQTYMEMNVDARTPFKNWTFWQYTDRGYGDIYGTQSKQVDLNYYNGDISDFRKEKTEMNKKSEDVIKKFEKVVSDLEEINKRIDCLEKDIQEIEKEIHSPERG